jgi:holo-[acyl-carrier protein] synthase
MVVTGDENRKPAFTLSGAIEQAAVARGVTAMHLSLSHDAGVAIAFVVLEAE